MLPPPQVRHAKGADLGDGLALPALPAVEEAAHRGRCGIEAASFAAPQPATRARLGVPPASSSRRRIMSDPLYVDLSEKMLSYVLIVGSQALYLGPLSAIQLDFFMKRTSWHGR